MRKTMLVALLLVAACSRQTPMAGSGERPDVPAPDAATTKQAGPDVAPTLLPGVALTYSYQYRVPAAQVARTQEQHAAQCEALGPARCRIAGMTYRAATRDAISGSLDLKLAPDVARAFGKQGTAAVIANGGMLAEATITSVDAGTTVAATERMAGSLSDEQRKIEAQLARPGAGAAERTQLQARLVELRDAQRATASTRADALLTLASTPMHIDYVAGDVASGFDDGPILRAAKDGWGQIIQGLAMMLTLALTLLPWVAAVLLVAWLWRRFGARLFAAKGGDQL